MDDASADAAWGLPDRDLAYVPEKGFEQLFLIDTFTRVDFVHLSIGQVVVRWLCDAPPKTSGLVRERQKSGVVKRNKCLVGAQNEPIGSRTS
jgi:hypothetical protein